MLTVPDPTATTVPVTPEPTATPAATAASAIPETVYYTQGGRYFHIERDCSGLENGIEGSVDEACRAGKEPCPICLAGWSFEMDAAPAEAAEAETAVESAGLAEAEAAEAEFPYAYLGLTPENLVYFAPDDQYFHFSADCSRLTGRVTVVTSLGAAMADRTACEACKPMEAAVVYNPAEGVMRSVATGDVLVYYNPNGNYFHVEYDCSGMRGAQLHTLAEAIEAGKLQCPSCIGESEKLYWLPVPEEDDDSVYTSPYSGYYHRHSDCFRLPTLDVETYGAVKENGALAPCPYCLPELAGDFGSPRCYAANGDNFYHTSSRCEVLSGDAMKMITELEAQAEGRVRCHACLDENALPAYGEEFVKLFGSWLGAAYPGWIFERADVCADGGACWYASTDADVSPNTMFACRVTPEPDGGVCFELGGGFFAEGDAISRYFLDALPEAILAACERDAVDAIQSAMEASNGVPANANEIFDDVGAIRIEAGLDGEMTAFEISFCADGDGIALRWQSEGGGYALCDVETAGED